MRGAVIAALASFGLAAGEPTLAQAPAHAAIEPPLETSSTNARVLPLAAAAVPSVLDVDGNALTEPLTDGLLILRWLFGFRGATLVAGAVGAGCTRCDAAAIESYLACAAARLDVDGDGLTQPLTDGLLTLRWLFGFRGATLVASAVGAGCTRCDAAAIEGDFATAALAPELCNSLDDDCDGAVDEDLGTFTCGLGACQTTVPACSGGLIGVCVPSAGSASDGPTCDGTDNDCDGAVDEDCASCVAVSLTGSDATGNGTFALPLLTIQGGVNWAVAHPAGPQRVCVAGGANCSASATYSGAVTMASGVAVLGGYQATLPTWSRCPTPSSRTFLAPGVATGVLFPASVTAQTTLDGFRIDRANLSTTAAVTVDGATNVVLSGLAVTNTPAVSNSRGIDVINGGDALVARSRIQSGNGSVESIAVRVVGGRVTLRDNCLSLDAFGRCDDFAGTTNPGLVGRTTAGAGESYAVLLDDAAGSVVDTSATSANDADIGAGIRVRGDATGILIRGNTVSAFGGALDSHGIWLEDCGGAAPHVVANYSVSAAGDGAATRVDAVRAVGDCHPVIEGNALLSGGGEGVASASSGVHCAPNAGGTGASCVVAGNVIRGSATGFPPLAIGVLCDAGSCDRISDNAITGRGGVDAIGVSLRHSNALVERNDISAGCATGTAAGLYAEGGSARIENNFIRGGDCTSSPGVVAVVSRGLRVVAELGPERIDVHSNAVLGLGLPGGACTSVGFEIEASGALPPSGGKGVVRNNVVHAGACATAYGVREASSLADPAIFENNDLSPQGPPTALYLDEGVTAVNTAAGVNLLGDMTVSGTFAVDPLFVLYPSNLHLQAASVCRGAGTPIGAPPIDIDAEPRSPTAPDVGADEVP